MKRARQTHFYAMPSDLREVLSELENSVGYAVRYTVVGTIRESVPDSYGSLLELPNLGVASHATAIAGDAYLISDRSAQISPVKMKGQTERWMIDQRSCPDSVLFMPGGMYDRSVLLYGNVATSPNSVRSFDMYDVFLKAIKRHWRKSNQYWIGKEAETHWRSGTRLTIGRDSPAEFDFRE